MEKTCFIESQGKMEKTCFLAKENIRNLSSYNLKCLLRTAMDK